MTNHNLPPTPSENNDFDSDSDDLGPIDLDGAWHISDGKSLTTYNIDGVVGAQLFVDWPEDTRVDESSNDKES